MGLDWRAAPGPVRRIVGRSPVRLRAAKMPPSATAAGHGGAPEWPMTRPLVVAGCNVHACMEQRQPKSEGRAKQFCWPGCWRHVGLGPPVWAADEGAADGASPQSLTSLRQSLVASYFFSFLRWQSSEACVSFLSGVRLEVPGSSHRAQPQSRGGTPVEPPLPCPPPGELASAGCCIVLGVVVVCMQLRRVRSRGRMERQIGWLSRRPLPPGPPSASAARINSPAETLHANCGRDICSFSLHLSVVTACRATGGRSGRAALSRLSLVLGPGPRAVRTSQSRE